MIISVSEMPGVSFYLFPMISCRSVPIGYYRKNVKIKNLNKSVAPLKKMKQVILIFNYHSQKVNKFMEKPFRSHNPLGVLL